MDNALSVSEPDFLTALHVSRHIAQLLGGELTLDTSYHDGARFVLTLPV